MVLESLIGHGIQCQGKDYEIVGVTGGDAYSIGGVEVFDVFDLSEYTFLEISRGGITGNTIEDTYTDLSIHYPFPRYRLFPAPHTLLQKPQ